MVIPRYRGIATVGTGGIVYPLLCGLMELRLLLTL
jgi:hypothetical protein